MSIAKLREIYGTNKKLEEEGVWYYPPHLGEKIGFLLARMARTNRKWQTELTKLYKENKRLFDTKDASDPVLERKVCDLFCRKILLDWSDNMVNDEGVKVPYSVEAGTKLLIELPELYDELAEEASAKVRYQQEVHDDIAKK